MLILVAILITLLTPLVILGLSFTRTKNGYLWLLATISTFIALGLVLVSSNNIPISITFPTWQPDIIFISSPMLLVDRISWPFAIAILTLILASLLVDIVHIDKLDPQTWTFTQALGGIGLVAVVAGNPITMLITWAVIDIAECGVLLFQLSTSRERERVVISFSVRIAGIILLISAMIIGQGLKIPLTFGEIPIQVGGLLMLAAGLRLGVFPPNQPYLRELLMRRTFGTIIRFVPCGASLVLLARVAHVKITGEWFLLIMALASITAILSAILWSQSEDELQGRSYWILGLSAFAMASAALGLPDATSAWGLAMFFSGALLFLISNNHRWFLILLALGCIGFSALPLTPTWEGSALFIALPIGFRVIFFFAQALMIVGYLRFALRSKPTDEVFERWMWLVYPIGLIMLPITHYCLIYIKWMRGFQDITFQTPGWWIGLISLVAVASILVVNRHISYSLNPLFSWFANAIDWIYRLIWWGYRAFGRTLHVVTRILEGDGSVLWALVILILLTVTISLWGNGERFDL